MIVFYFYNINKINQYILEKLLIADKQDGGYIRDFPLCHKMTKSLNLSGLADL
jgi:hypothetical protein